MINVADITITRDDTIRDGLSKLEASGVGVLLLTNGRGEFERTITDGDLRRLILVGRRLDDQLTLLPTIRSVVIALPFSRRDALAVMSKHGIDHLPVVGGDGRVADVLERRVLDDQILLSTPHMGNAEMEFVEEAFRTNWIAPLGPNVDAFERELAEKVGIKHAAALSSGTAAIHLALRLLDVAAGDRVFCSTLTFAATANPIIYQGAEPIFIDSETESWNMSPQALNDAFSWAVKDGKLPKAVVVVNLYGQSANMDALLDICGRYDVPIVEDAAESLGAQYKGRSSGTCGHLGVYSFNGNKIITTSGGGMLVSDDGKLIERARFLSTQARDPAPHYQHSEIGYNYRMSNILAGVGRGQLQVLDERVRARRSIFQRYREELVDVSSVKWMPEPEWSYSTHWLSTCTLTQGGSGSSVADVVGRLTGEMIEARPLWKPMHLQPVFSGCHYFPSGAVSNSDDLFSRGICLPSGSNMTEEALDRVIGTLRSILT